MAAGGLREADEVQCSGERWGDGRGLRPKPEREPEFATGSGEVVAIHRPGGAPCAPAQAGCTAGDSPQGNDSPFSSLGVFRLQPYESTFQVYDLESGALTEQSEATSVYDL